MVSRSFTTCLVTSFLLLPVIITLATSTALRPRKSTLQIYSRKRHNHTAAWRHDSQDEVSTTAEPASSDKANDHTDGGVQMPLRLQVVDWEGGDSQNAEEAQTQPAMPRPLIYLRYAVTLGGSFWAQR